MPFRWQTVLAGPYQYNLFRGSQDGLNPMIGFLRSSGFRPQVALTPALPSLALLYGRFKLDTLHQRVGEEEQLRYKRRISRSGFFQWRLGTLD